MGFGLIARKRLHILLIIAALLALLPASRANVSSDVGPVPSDHSTGKHADVTYLVQLMNEFLEVDGKDPDEARNLVKQVKREMSRLDREGTMIEKFRPIHMTDDDIAEKIRSLAKYKKTAANLKAVSLVKIVDVAVVCIGLFTGSCEAKPEMNHPQPILTQGISGGAGSGGTQ